MASALIHANAQTVTLKISNPGHTQRQEVVEADYQAVCRQLNIGTGTPVAVLNAYGQQQVCQITSDGRLLLDVAVQPHGTATYTVMASQGDRQVSHGDGHAVTSEDHPSGAGWVAGKVYPQRADDLTWENDRGIYRMYGPALQRSGEKAFGTDVWVKNTPELVVEERYRQHLWGVRQRDSLNRIGRKEEANAIYMATSFHHDHGYGLDCYAVGPSLGCGAPALMKDGQLVFPYCWKECRIRDNGPLRFTAELTYHKTADGITEHRLVSLDKGSHFNRITVSYEGITAPVALCAGVVLHTHNTHPLTPSRGEGELDTPTAKGNGSQGNQTPLPSGGVGGGSLSLADDFVLYADPTENPAVNQTQIYVGTLFPENVDETVLFESNPPHGLGVVHQYSGEPYTYYFGSAWSGYDIRTFEQWQLCAKEYLQNIKTPLTIEIQ